MNEQNKRGWGNEYIWINHPSEWGFGNNKKGFWRIVEAFFSVLIMLAGFLLIQQKQNVYVEQERARYNDTLRDVVLDSKEELLYAGLRTHVIGKYNYSVRICPLTDICSQFFLYTR